MSAQITITLDPLDRSQVKAVYQLLRGLHGEEVTTVSVEIPDLVTGKAAIEATKEVKTKVVKKAETKTEEPDTETTALETAPKEEKAVTKDAGDNFALQQEISALVSKHVPNHRVAIKAQLAKHGTKNVSGLSVEAYEEMHTFLKNLK